MSKFSIRNTHPAGKAGFEIVTVYRAADSYLAGALHGQKGWHYFFAAIAPNGERLAGVIKGPFPDEDLAMIEARQALAKPAWDDEIRNFAEPPPYERAEWIGEGRDKKPAMPRAGKVRWGSEEAPPAIGARILVTMNNLGPAIVRGYFTQHGWLGILADLEAPPEWHKRQNNNNPRGHLFGPEFKAIAAEEPAAEPKLEEGAILYTSWGYDQTNVDFHRVEKIAGAFLTVRKIRKVEASDDTADNPGTMTGRVVPADPIDPIGEPKRRKILPSESGAVAKLDSYAYAYLWDGKPKRVSHYA